MNGPLAYAEVIGDPIAHSKSPAIHNHWLQALGIKAEYRAHHVPPSDLAAYLAARRKDPDWRGCNVTIPHKISVLPFADDCSPAVMAIGAANCIAAKDGGLTAHNTDADGFAAPLFGGPAGPSSAPFFGHSLHGETAIVIGAGGAARAVLHALAARGVHKVVIVNRTAAKARVLLREFGLAGTVLPPGAPLPPAALLVNASSLGMTGQPPLHAALSALPGNAVVYDIVYDPLETPLLAAARARGLAAVDGLDMLIGQARAAFALFFGMPPPPGDADIRRILTS